MDAKEIPGLGSDLNVPKMTAALQPADFAGGCVARYLGSEIKESKMFRNEQRLHQFELGASFNRARFALWGAVQLDQKLRQVQRGSIVVIQYQGKGDTERAQHVWTVRPFKGSSGQLQDLADRFKDGSAAVAMAIAYIEQGQNFAGTEDDDDLPF